MGQYRNLQRCRLGIDSALHCWLTMTLMVGLLANYGASQSTVQQSDSVQPYFNSSIIFYKQGENGYYGNNVTVGTDYLQSSANKSWFDNETALPNGTLKKFYFMAHSYTKLDNTSTRIRLQIWRPVNMSIPRLTLLWQQLVQVSPNPSIPLVYTYTVQQAVVLMEGDRIGWAFEGNAGPISFRYVEQHRTYFTAFYATAGAEVNFDPVYLPSMFSVAVSVEKYMTAQTVPQQSTQTVPQQSGRSGGAMTGGDWKMTVLFTVFVFLKIAASATK